MGKAKVVLVAFYNVKALGVRYLESALHRAGYSVTTVFFKNFNSVRPQPTNEAEIKNLADIVEAEKPLFVAYSVMSSMYLETVDKVIDGVKARCPDMPSVCGGTYATMFPERFLKNGVDYVIRSDGEIPICRLADALLCGESINDFPSLCYMEGDRPVINPVGDLLSNIDEYGQPAIECENAFFIENGKITSGDPQLEALSYEVIASRGCPYTCSYCCCVNLHRLLPKGTKHVRTRSVKSVIDELITVKEKFKRLVFIHFYDEIFPNQPGWVDEFVKEYRAKIKMPFTIWSHPKMIDGEVLKKLVGAGLTEVIMGIQSGSERIRRNIFHRYETQEDIIDATRKIKEAGVFWASYDFMLQHPFETIDDLKQSYYLVKQLCQPFELQLHGLNFLPGTDIVDMAVEQGIVSKDRMDEIMYAPMSSQFEAYWKQESDCLSRLWYRMIYCLQYPSLRRKTEAFEGDPAANKETVDALYEKAKKRSRYRYYWKKANMVLRRIGIFL